MRKTFKKLGIIVTIAIILSLLIYACTLVRPDQIFWKNTVSNLLATLVGLAAGVPVGLWINRLITNKQTKNRETAERRRELEILDFIKKEIEFCNNNVFPFRPQQANSYLRAPYKTATWDAYCAGGEIKYIVQPDLLNQIAYAYHHIKAQNKIERQILIAFNAGRIAEGNQLIQDARFLDPQFIDQVNKALEGIDVRMKTLKTDYWNQVNETNKNPVNNENIFRKLEIFLLIFTLIAATFLGVQQNNINRNIYQTTNQQTEISKQLQNLNFQPILSTSYNLSSSTITFSNFSKLPIFIDTTRIIRIDSNKVNKECDLIGRDRSIPPGESTYFRISEDYFSIYQQLNKGDFFIPFTYQIFFQVTGLPQIYIGETILFFDEHEGSFRVSNNNPEILPGVYISKTDYTNFKDLYEKVICPN